MAGGRSDWPTRAVALVVAVLHYWEVYCHHSLLNNLAVGEQKVVGLKTENAFYYSYYEETVEAPTLAAAVRHALRDDRSEAPNTINAVYRFNIYQELLCGMLYRVLRSLVGTRWAPDPWYFYRHASYALQAAGHAALVHLAAACGGGGMLGGAVPGAALAILLFLHRGDIGRIHDVGMLNLRENWALPVIFCQVYALHMFLASHPALWGRADAKPSSFWLWALRAGIAASIVLWQFSAFAFLLQVSAVFFCALLSCTAGARRVLWDVVKSNLVGVAIAAAMLFGNELLVHHMLVTQCIAILAVLRIHPAPPRHWRPFLWWVDGALAVGLFTILRLLQSRWATAEEHIGEIFAAKVQELYPGLFGAGRKEPTFNARLYLAVSIFQFMDWATVKRGLPAGLYHFAAAGAFVWALAFLRRAVLGSATAATAGTAPTACGRKLGPSEAELHGLVAAEDTPAASADPTAPPAQFLTAAELEEPEWQHVVAAQDMPGPARSDVKALFAQFLTAAELEEPGWRRELEHFQALLDKARSIAQARKPAAHDATTAVPTPTTGQLQAPAVEAEPAQMDEGGAEDISSDTLDAQLDAALLLEGTGKKRAAVKAGGQTPRRGPSRGPAHFGVRADAFAYGVLLVQLVLLLALACFISRLKVIGAPLLCVLAAVAAAPRPLEVALGLAAPGAPYARSHHAARYGLFIAAAFVQLGQLVFLARRLPFLEGNAWANHRNFVWRDGDTGDLYDWMNRHLPPRVVVTASMPLSAQLRLNTPLRVVIHPQFEARSLRNRVQEIYELYQCTPPHEFVHTMRKYGSFHLVLEYKRCDFSPFVLDTRPELNCAKDERPWKDLFCPAAHGSPHFEMLYANPGYVVFRVRDNVKGRTAVAIDNLKAWKPMLERCLEQDPKACVSRIAELATMFKVKLRQPRIADALFGWVRAHGAKDGLTQYVLGRHHDYDLEKPADAGTYYQKAQELEPNNPLIFKEYLLWLDIVARDNRSLVKLLRPRRSARGDRPSLVDLGDATLACEASVTAMQLFRDPDWAAELWDFAKSGGMGSSCVKTNWPLMSVHGRSMEEDLGAWGLFSNVFLHRGMTSELDSSAELSVRYQMPRKPWNLGLHAAFEVMPD